MTVREIRLNKGLTYRTYPHRCEQGALEFKIAEFALDGGDPVEPEGENRLDLHEYENWETLSLKLEITVPDGLLGKVFPELGEIPGRLIVATHCRSTYLRERIIVKDDPIQSGTFSKEVSIEAEDVTGTLHLRPFLIRSEPSDVEVSGDYATDPGVFVADDAKWTIDLEDEDHGTDNNLEVRKRPFSEEDENSRFPPEDRLYYLDLESDPSDPIVWINEDHTRVAGLMEVNEGDQYERLTSDLIWNQVMTPVWTRLVTIAGMEYDSESDEWTPEWQAAVFEDIHAELYEDTSPEKAAERLQEDLHEATIDATKRIEDAVQELLDPATQYTKHIQTLNDK